MTNLTLKRLDAEAEASLTTKNAVLADRTPHSNDVEADGTDSLSEPDVSVENITDSGDDSDYEPEWTGGRPRGQPKPITSGSQTNKIPKRKDPGSAPQKAASGASGAFQTGGGPVAGRVQPPGGKGDRTKQHNP